MPYVNAVGSAVCSPTSAPSRTRIARLNQLRKMEEDGTFDMLPKKEVIKA